MLRSSFIALLLCWSFLSVAQQDTVQLGTFSLSDHVAPSESFKTSVIDSTALEQLETATLAALLVNSGPLFIKNYGPGSIASVSFRGTGASHTKLFWNGLPINSPSLGQIDLNTIPLFLVDEISVHHGAASLVDGNGGLGGGIQLGSTLPTKEGLGLTFLQQLGSFQSFMSGIEINYHKKKWTTSLRLFHKEAQNDFTYHNVSKSDNPIETQRHAATIQQGLSHALGYNWSDKTKLSYQFMFTQFDRQLPPLMQQDFFFEETMKDQAIRAVVNLKTRGKSIAYFARAGVNMDQNSYSGPSLDEPSLNNNSTFFAQAGAKKYLKKGTVDVQLSNQFNHADISAYAAPQTRNNLVMLIKYNRAINDRLKLNLLARQEMYDDTISPFLPSIGITYELAKNLYFSQNINRIYNMPSLNDLYWPVSGNTDLKPEQGWTGEQTISYRKSANKNHFETSITGFYGEIHDWILWSPAANGVWSPANIKSVNNKGVEFASTIKKTTGKFTWLVRADYSYTSSTNISIADTSTLFKQLIYVPEHQVKIAAGISFKTISFTYQHNVVGKRYISSDNNWYMPDYNLGRIIATYAFVLKSKHQMKMTFAAENVWDTPYQAMAWRPMPGRYFSFSLKYNLL